MFYVRYRPSTTIERRVKHLRNYDEFFHIHLIQAYEQQSTKHNSTPIYPFSLGIVVICHLQHCDPQSYRELSVIFDHMNEHTGGRCVKFLSRFGRVSWLANPVNNQPNFVVTRTTKYRKHQDFDCNDLAFCSIPNVFTKPI